MRRAAGISLRVLSAAAAVVFSLSPAAAQERVQLAQVRPQAGGYDAGALPESAPVSSITVTLKRTVAQTAALEGFLHDVRTPGTVSYHQWLTPATFAAQFAPAASQLAQVSAWLQSQGMHVTSTSPSGMRLTVSGTALQANTAFAVSLHRLVLPAGDGVAVQGTPSVPAALGSLVASVDGLDGTADPVFALEDAVDANASTVLAADLKTSSASAEEWNEVLAQAAAQGQTVVLTHVAKALLPARALVLTSPSADTFSDATVTTTPRPEWQVAPGLPADGLRGTPDAAAANVAAVVSALQSVALAGGRQGEIASRMYAVASLEGVFTHADAAVPAGTWSAVDGLGTIDVAKLIKALATGATPPLNSQIVLSTRNLTHGQSVTVTATITGGSGTPTGTVSFGSAQDGTIGSAPLTARSTAGTAVATYSTNALPGGLHGFFATYNGDSTYSVSTSNVDTATIQPEAVVITGSVTGTPAVGTTIPVLVTVKSASGVGTPSGSVTVNPFGTALGQTAFTGTLSSTSAGTATATVNIPATNAGSYTFQTNCTTDASFSCNQPATFPVTEAKGTPLFTLKQTGSSAMTLTATASVPAGAPGTVVAPTGTVQFLNNGVVFATVPLDSTGTAFYAGTITPNGPITASYGGDGNYTTATATANATATKVTPTVALTVVTAGSSLSATVTPPTGTSTVPTGTVQFLQGSTALGTATLNAAGVATFNGTYGTTGALTAVYGGDANFNTATSNAVDPGKVTPTVTLTKTSSSAANTVSLSAAVTSTSTKTPTGSVQFLDGTTALGTATLNSAGVATYTGALAATAKAQVAPLATTTHTLTAVYAGDTNFNTATSNAVTADATTALISTTTSLTSSSGYSGPFGTSFTFNVVVTPASYTATGVSPSGTVTISDASGVVGTGTLNSTGNATITISTLSVGAHALTATYNGDSFYAASTSSPAATVTITAVTATVSATVTPAGSIPYGYDANLNITVTASAGSTGPAGTVTASINGSPSTATLSATTGSLISTATISFPVPPPGTYTITITCGAGLTCTNNATARITTTKGFTKTTLNVGVTNPQAGVGTTLTATVANTGTGSGTYTYGGTVTFYSGNRVLGSSPVTNGTATATVIYISAQAQSVYAVYSGDTNWNGSTSDPTTVTPLPIQAVISLSANTLNGIVSQNITLTASVNSGLTTVTLVPTGKVTFYDTFNGIVVNLGSASLLSNGLNAAYATLSTTGLQAGTHTIMAVYSGDATFTNVTSSTILVNIGDFSLSAVPTMPVFTQGTTGQVTILVGSLNGFTGTVALGCTPPGGTQTTCSISPASVPAGSSATLTISSTRSTPKQAPGKTALAMGAAALAGLCLLGLRRYRIAAVLMLLLTVMMMSGGCTQVAETGDSGGNTGTGGTTNNGTPLGTFSFAITGAAVDAPVAARHTVNVQVTFQ